MHIDEIDYSALSATERLQLAQVLLDSVLYDAETEPFTAEQMKELDRRLHEIDTGKVQGEPWPQVKQRLMNNP
jgi:putative addiction module component (TIGR02574 family)